MATGHEKQKTRKTKSIKPLTSTSARDAISNTDRGPSPRVPLTLQQRCLDILRDALSPSRDDTEILQEVKGHLYNRDFSAAFGKGEYLRVYASRWSPSRALAYLDIFADIRSSHASTLDFRGDSPFSVICVGGGAGGELIALAGWLNSLRTMDSPHLPSRFDVSLVDIADWTGIVNDLSEKIKNPPFLSKYASQAKKDANEALVNQDELSISFRQMDVLSTEEALVKPLYDQISKANLITIMFTSNELYSTSMSKTQNLLSQITAAAAPGTLLLVVDSPGSYSTVSLNGAEKNYPMKWLLDYTLLGAQKKSGPKTTDAKWEKLVDDASRWFRLPTGLDYPIELENMRYQIHLYLRLDEDE